MATFRKNLLVTLCALTRTTERAARRRGVGYFLPALFVDRFANLGGLDKTELSAQLDACRSFEDEAWVGYWRDLAAVHLGVAAGALERLGGPRLSDVLDGADSETTRLLGEVLGPAVEVFADRTPENAAGLVDDFAARHPEHRDAAVAIGALLKAITYLFAASWPGWTPARLAAYRECRRLFEALLFALAPAAGASVERLRVTVDGDEVVAYALFPPGEARMPAVLISNGLEGTIEEALLPVLRFRDAGLAVVVMEMPGTFAYRNPLSPRSEGVYTAVIDHLASHPRIDPDRLGMVGLSFGAHWSTRMAARDSRLKAVVSNGGLYHRSFQPAATFGMPEIMLWTLERTTGASSSLDLARRLGALSLKHLYREIAIPVLAINGDNDTLVSTQDTVDLAEQAPLGELRLYPDDDHCAMGHYTEWLDDSLGWLKQQLEG